MLFQRLLDRQRQLRLSDRQFANLLGIPRSTWQLTRTGVRPVGRRVAVAALQTFPDLAPDVALFLLSSATSVARAAMDVAYRITSSHQEGHNDHTERTDEA